MRLLGRKGSDTSKADSVRPKTDGRRYVFLAWLALICLSSAGMALAQGQAVRPSGWSGVLFDALLLFGCAFLLAAAIGLIRFPDFYVRLHATTKLVTLGGVGIFGGAAIAFAGVQATERVLLIALFFFLTAPLSGYMIARAGYLRGIEPYAEDTSVDEWGALGSAKSEMPARDDAAEPPFETRPNGVK